MKIAAILAAGGKGERFNNAITHSQLPKQFKILKGKPLFIWSLSTLCRQSHIEHIVVVMVADMVEAAQEAIVEHLDSAAKKVSVIPGGKNRQESVYFGLQALARCKLVPKYVLVHDAARPFLLPRDLDKVIASLPDCDGCTLASPIRDTIKRVDGINIVETLDRQTTMAIQTPQAARFDLLYEGHKKARERGIEMTDDAAIIELEHRVRVIEGSSLNFKITTSDDFELATAFAEIWFQFASSMSIS